MTDQISNILKLAAKAMNQGQTLLDFHEQLQAHVLANMLNGKQDHEGAAMLACGMSRAVWRSNSRSRKRSTAARGPMSGAESSRGA